MKETILACPRCSLLLMAATLVHGKILPNHRRSDNPADKTYINLRCVNCQHEMQFEVNLAPEIEHERAATGL